MTSSQRSVLALARQRVFGIYADEPALVMSAVVDRARREATDEERAAAEAYGFERLFGEVERQRTKGGLRRGERALSLVGEPESLFLLEMTVPQARIAIRGKMAHAFGALGEAQFERAIIDLVEERMVERGLDPLTTTKVIGDYIGVDEIAAMRTRKAA